MCGTVVYMCGEQVGASLKALELLDRDLSLIEKLRAHTHLFRDRLTAAGFEVKGARYATFALLVICICICRTLPHVTSFQTYTSSRHRCHPLRRQLDSNASPVWSSLCAAASDVVPLSFS